ncbi:LAQU0S03e06678g1_1 [Lachancea quebecensis]|uniref:Pre-mRNA-splicing factor 38 n=1 Tax=Lachancea quebecensis TaxID=1654605 RepID=A0A0P1KPR7_9SACH|nr:LAQU0S03e06678g1_1 [Lachancea quebecensis]
MPREFHVDENVSAKQLNHQSTSLVIPQLARTRIHNSMYYKINLDPVSLRGDTMVQLSKTMMRDFGSCRDSAYRMVLICGGVEFKCLLMKLVHLKPQWSQLVTILQKGNERSSKFDNKYLVVLVLVYLRIQYYFLPDTPSEERVAGILDLNKRGNINSGILRKLFKIYLNDYRKIKSIDLDVDYWTNSASKAPKILHIDEVVDWLCTKDQIWGIPLGRCQWCDIFKDPSSEDESSEDSSNESDESGDDSSNDSEGESSGNANI